MIMKIICDTNIWYGIANKTVPNSKINNLYLIASNVTLWEFLTTENWLKNPYMVLRAIKAMFEHSKEIYHENPIDYILQIVDREYKPRDFTANFLLAILRKLVTLNERQIKTYINNVPDFKEHIMRFSNSRKRIENLYNEKAEETKENLKENGIGKKEFRQIDTYNGIKESIKYVVEKYSQFKIDWDSFDWRKIELFSLIWSKYHKEINISGMKFQKNDTNDIFNLVYVQPDSQYWTLENKKWAKILKEESELRKYVYL